MARKTRYTGIVRWFSQARGYGFINGDNDKQYFLHIEAIESGDHYLDEGDRVSFSVRPPYNGNTQKHWRAVEVRLLEDQRLSSPGGQAVVTQCAMSPAIAVPVESADQTIQTAPPGVPDALASIEIASATSSLVNKPEGIGLAHKRLHKKNPFDRLPTTDPSRFVGRTTEINSSLEFLENFKSFIISGAPGVGKSSFLNQLSQILARQKEALEKFDAAQLLPAEKVAVTRHSASRATILTTSALG